jgi:hypothetical protein
MNGFWRKLSVLAAGLCMVGGILSEPSHASDESSALALIGVDMRDDGIEVVGTALAAEAGAFKGEMVIDRRGASGSVSTRQSRDVVLAAGEQADIARVAVSYRPGDRLSVTLTLTRDGAVVSKATLSTAEN